MNQSMCKGKFSRDSLEKLLKKRFFYNPSFDIYGKVSGLYDYGPLGCSLKNNIINEWRKHFIFEDELYELDTPILTPHVVLKTSGHVDKFVDWMSKDTKSGEIFRTDHLIKNDLTNRLEKDLKLKDNKKSKQRENKLDDRVKKKYEEILVKLDDFSGDELGAIMKEHQINNPTTNDVLEPPVQFNLMFETTIGPSGNLKAYLRPETAQGQFLNFNKLFDYNNERMPFGSATIGKSFRNEISPRSGLLRVREFLMAEIEYYVDPLNKEHKNFEKVKNIELNFLSKEKQESGSSEIVRMTIDEAVRTRMVDNQTLGYFLGRINIFLLKIGINENKLRFRQHMSNEMAHYASDCWDAELHTSYGWIECVGCADRAAYDLTCHSTKTNEKLVVREKLTEPLIIDKFEIEFSKKKFGPKFRKNSELIQKFLLNKSQLDLEKLSNEINLYDKINVYVDSLDETIELDTELITIEKKKSVSYIREYTPNVIEPSFGIGRIIYCLFEHQFWIREKDNDRNVLSFYPLIAPVKVLIVPLSSNDSLNKCVNEIADCLKKNGLFFKIDNSSVSIGKRYSRNDELGTPFAITADFQSVQDNTITLRERDSTKQVRGSLEKIIIAIKNMVFNSSTWNESTCDLLKL